MPISRVRWVAEYETTRKCHCASRGYHSARACHEAKDAVGIKRRAEVLANGLNIVDRNTRIERLNGPADRQR